ncbi:MAG: deoxyuridine 5'-triphosphate nucleotidohydrolase [Candidatus Micrarchaeota archaeon]|nr:deoxyuridine 5'-triphosphate nucleotidohydrolase [Candidatus Micrarchaeota archaeon]
MIVPGSKSIAFITETVGEGQLQPCGVDMTLREVHALTDAGEIDFDNSKRKISKSAALAFDSNGKLHLAQGCYKIVYNEYVSVPIDACAFGFPRSSLLRCGADVRCAVWDPGYHGRSESLLVVHSAHGITLHKNAKVMQLVFVRLESAAHKGYEGQYKGENK